MTLDLTQLRSLTDDFNESQEVGSGGFGTVFQAKALNGRAIAIKRGNVRKL